MFVSAEISCYPLSDDFSTPIDHFVEQVRNSGLKYEAGSMSTVISGEYGAVMDFLNGAMASLMRDYPSVFTLKISNACVV